MNRFDNPFHDLWVTEILDPKEFVKMFSPMVASHAEELFGTGNVVVRGRQGSGKSMLLGLLNTKTRVAYANSGTEYPAPNDYKAFIAAGINLTRDNARIVTARLSELPEPIRRGWAAATFADYVNYLLVQDLLRNVIYLAEEQISTGALENELPVNWSGSYKSKLTEILLLSDVWGIFFEGCKSIEEIVKRVSFRLSEYRRYFNFSVNSLNAEIEKTKTDIGEPVAVLAEALRESGVLPREALIYLKIDQHEELYELERSSGTASLFRQVINRMLAMRDGRVAYRIGTRHYAWTEEMTVWGSGAYLENMRDYSMIDIDSILKRNENKALGFPFKDFAEDVFRRRLGVYGLDVSKPYPKGLLFEVFGDSIKPIERAKLYVKGKPSQIRLPRSYAPEWQKVLDALWESDPLDAMLGAAWLRQRAQQRSGIARDASKIGTFPWRDRPYWRKERYEAALVQIAGECNETLIWSGKSHLIDLSGSNILAFMTICRAIWAAWLRKLSDAELESIEFPRIGVDEQVIGVAEASRIWADKLKEGTDGDKRARFISALGAWFSRRIRGDKALSNPGHNGISLLVSEFDNKNFISDLIRSCRDQGDLIESSHTTKTKDAKPRKKWYLNPLLSPNFRIPHVRTKEPIYVSIGDLTAVYNDSLVEPRSSKYQHDDGPTQTELF
ncbi:hypothetical protein [Silvimonas sp.]|uniref:ORC-CDC6 family AAA ATPase n=1 Tax=Silvimonas sp. TaxID=2650811 RepID=UPI002849F4A6|nr:hypothetical protein [Silvimonas sp.]MDR3427367.1 hypothetical protein [Silvimonas sp.]